MRATHRLALTAAALLIVTACSEDDDASSTDTTSSATTGTEDADTTDAADAGATSAPDDSSTAQTESGTGDQSAVGLGALGLATTTPAGTEPVDSITWALYRTVNSLDPVFAFDYPENTVLALLCEQPLRQAPDGSIVPFLADVETPDDTTYVLTIKEGAAFWNGDPVTAADVAFSLGRNMDPAIPSFYSPQYVNVSAIDVTDERTVTITMTQPDLWFRNTLASSSAWIVQQSFVEAAGPEFGNPTGRTMCSGSFQLGDWSIGSSLVAERNDDYWNSEIAPLVAEIEFIGAPDPIALSAALQSGDVDGYYAFASIPTLDALRSDPNLTVTDGAGYQFDALLVAPREGSPLADVRVRQALSKAIDRQGYIDTVLVGAAAVPASFAAPGTWGYAGDVFQAGYDALPALEQDLDAARSLVADAGAEGASITIGLIGEVPGLVAEGAVFQKAADDIGMSVDIKTYPAEQYISLFIDPAARADVDAWFTVAYGDAADPAMVLATGALPGGPMNYLPYDNPEVTSLLMQARATADDDQRASLTVDAQAIIMDELPLIPVALPNNTLITSSDLTGAVPSFSMMFAPWANDLGGS
jgi:peptide/nickel transport system substrate-binding protein